MLYFLLSSASSICLGMSVRGSAREAQAGQGNCTLSHLALLKLCLPEHRAKLLKRTGVFALSGTRGQKTQSKGRGHLELLECLVSFVKHHFFFSIFNYDKIGMT